MERETQEIKAGKHTFVVKTYATARELHQIQQAYFKGTKLEIVGESPKISEFNPAVQFDVYQETVRQMVLSMDGSADNIVDRCIDLPSEVFDEVMQQLDALVTKKKK